ncbi:hypothetical protein BRADI_2g15157v3 [Brachypodium distachyon]|uniref:Uncharacterized protein n=1 Tax=Brachypodium distachyon TaxID=15368 RepID=A0A0Q3FZ68_BRADI|nr:hypothetical protein BRADI_2g15157v3 [Brachypodium distachyon]
MLPAVLPSVLPAVHLHDPAVPCAAALVGRLAYRGLAVASLHVDPLRPPRRSCSPRPRALATPSASSSPRSAPPSLAASAAAPPSSDRVGHPTCCCLRCRPLPPQDPAPFHASLSPLPPAISLGHLPLLYKNRSKCSKLSIEQRSRRRGKKKKKKADELTEQQPPASGRKKRGGRRFQQSISSRPNAQCPPPQGLRHPAPADARARVPDLEFEKRDRGLGAGLGGQTLVASVASTLCNFATATTARRCCREGAPINIDSFDRFEEADCGVTRAIKSQAAQAKHSSSDRATPSIKPVRSRSLRRRRAQSNCSPEFVAATAVLRVSSPFRLSHLPVPNAVTRSPLRLAAAAASGRPRRPSSSAPAAARSSRRLRSPARAARAPACPCARSVPARPCSAPRPCAAAAGHPPRAPAPRAAREPAACRATPRRPPPPRARRPGRSPALPARAAAGELVRRPEP